MNKRETYGTNLPHLWCSYMGKSLCQFAFIHESKNPPSIHKYTPNLWCTTKKKKKRKRKPKEKQSDIFRKKKTNTNYIVGAHKQRCFSEISYKFPESSVIANGDFSCLRITRPTHPNRKTE